MSAGKRECKYEEEMELRRGPWTLEEDTLLIHYIACHGEGRWNLLARCSGLKRTGKSCRLRWLNYLKPDVKRGNLTPEEQILILDLHSKWGNRWSRIAQHLPGRTDNEIKNYWRTRVQKQARQLKIDANSTLFRDAVRCFWMPRLVEKMSSSPPSQYYSPITAASTPPPAGQPSRAALHQLSAATRSQTAFDDCGYYDDDQLPQFGSCGGGGGVTADAAATAAPPLQLQPRGGSSQWVDATQYSDAFDYAIYTQFLSGHDPACLEYGLDMTSPTAMTAPAAEAVGSTSTSDCSMMEKHCTDSIGKGLWNMDELWQVRKLHEWGI